MDTSMQVEALAEAIEGGIAQAQANQPPGQEPGNGFGGSTEAPPTRTRRNAAAQTAASIGADPIPDVRMGRPAPTKAQAVLPPQDYLRIYWIDDHGKSNLIDTYPVSDIARHGDAKGFVVNVLVPKYGGGDYVFYTLEANGVEIPRGKVAIPRVMPAAMAPMPSAAPLPPGIDPATAANPMLLAYQLQQLQRQDYAEQRREAENRAEKEQEREDKLLKALKGEDGKTLDPALLMLMMQQHKSTESTPTYAPNPVLEQLAQQVQWLISQQQQQQAPAPPSPPVERPYTPPPPSAGETAASLAQAFAPIVNSIVDAVKPRGESFTVRDFLTAAPVLLAALVQAGLLGQKGPVGPTMADVQLAEVKAKLEVMSQGGTGPEDMMEWMSKFVVLMQSMRQPNMMGTMSDWAAVAMQAIDRLPNIAESFSAMATSAAITRGGTNMLTGPSSTRPKTPVPMTRLRNAVLAVPGRDGEKEHDTLVVQAAISNLKPVHMIDRAWAQRVNSLIEAIVSEDDDMIKQALGQLVLAAWNPKKDSKARAFYQMLLVIVQRHKSQISLLLTGQKPPEVQKEAEAGLDDLMGSVDEEATYQPDLDNEDPLSPDEEVMAGAEVAEEHEEQPIPAEEPVAVPVAR